MTVLGKLVDALQMFWQALDEQERRLVLYVTVYSLATVILGAQSLARERRETRLRAEILAELRGHGSGQ